MCHLCHISLAKTQKRQAICPWLVHLAADGRGHAFVPYAEVSFTVLCARLHRAALKVYKLSAQPCPSHPNSLHGCKATKLLSRFYHVCAEEFKNRKKILGCSAWSSLFHKIHLKTSLTLPLRVDTFLWVSKHILPLTMSFPFSETHTRCVMFTSMQLFDAPRLCTEVVEMLTCQRTSA